MRAKLESLPMSQLRDIAKQQGIKYIMKLRKSDLINEILKATGYESEVLGEVSESGNEDLDRLPENDDNKTSGGNDKEEEKNQEKESKGKVHVYHTFEKDCVNRAKSPMAKGMSGDQEENLIAEGILEVMPEGYGFIRCENFLPGENDVYVSPSQIRRFHLKTGDILNGQMRLKNTNEKFGAMTHLNMVNDIEIEDSMKRPNFEDLTPIFPNQRLKMETISENMAFSLLTEIY